MTDEERREAERLAEAFGEAFIAGRESMQSELERQIKINSEDEHYRHKYLAQLEAERARSAKLELEIEFLRRYGNKDCTAQADSARAEYEASRD